MRTLMRTLLRTLLALGGLLLLALVWGVLVEPRLIDERHEIGEMAGLPVGWQGQELAVLADLQVGMWLGNTGTARRMVERLVAQPPAAVLVAGDLIYHPLGHRGSVGAGEAVDARMRARAAVEIERAVALLRPLTQAGIPTFAVPGNHDYGMQSPRAARLDWLADDLQQALESAGVTMLRNQAAAVPAPGGGPLLYVVGIDSHYAGRDDPARALSDVPADAPRIVIMHHPESFPALPARSAGLAVAAHTHGGQVSVPLTRHWSWMGLLNPGEIHADGWIENGFGAAGNRLYVNRGVGFSVVPVRIGAAPELTRFELRAPD